MTRWAGPRKAATLSEFVLRQLNLYVLSATAAGVGALAIAPSSEGKVIYTPVHKTLRLHQYYPIDLNHDGNIDFTPTNYGTCITGGCFYSLFQRGAPGNGAIGYLKSFRPMASALKGGARIGPGGQFFAGDDELVRIFSGSDFDYVFGQWVNVQRRYLGLRFKIKGRMHYGWARLNVKVVRPPHAAITAVLTGYAYETIPNKPIFAGETKGTDRVKETVTPGTLGRLAAGIGR
jgi:hypothetical protein